MGNFIIEGETIQSQKSADIIINSLENYKTDYGLYPEKLDELIPKYIDKIPMTHMGILGNEYDYKIKEERNRYSLSFVIAYLSASRYDSKNKHWYIDD